MRVADYKQLRVYKLAFESALEIFDHICRQLRKMMDDAASWCGTGCELREVPAEYFVEASERKRVESVSGDRQPSEARRFSRSKR